MHLWMGHNHHHRHLLSLTIVSGVRVIFRYLFVAFVNNSNRFEPKQIISKARGDLLLRGCCCYIKPAFYFYFLLKFITDFFPLVFPFWLRRRSFGVNTLKCGGSSSSCRSIVIFKTKLFKEIIVILCL